MQQDERITKQQTYRDKRWIERGSRFIELRMSYIIERHKRMLYGCTALTALTSSCCSAK